MALGLFAGVAAIIKCEKQKTAISDPNSYIHDTFSMWKMTKYLWMNTERLAIQWRFLRVCLSGQGTIRTAEERWRVS